jgi:hypothetical protein
MILPDHVHENSLHRFNRTDTAERGDGAKAWKSDGTLKIQPAR